MFIADLFHVKIKSAVDVVKIFREIFGFNDVFLVRFEIELTLAYFQEFG